MSGKSDKIHAVSVTDRIIVAVLAQLESMGVIVSGSATEATLANLLTELQLKADLTETQPVSVITLPLPLGASTEVTLAAVLAKIIAAPSTEAKQDAEIVKLNDALGGDGTEYIYVSTGAVSSKTYKYLVANEDCTFTTLTGSVTADLKATLGIAANTVSKGMIIRGLSGETVTAVTMATGSVIGVR